jgi:hypothetical protein
MSSSSSHSNATFPNFQNLFDAALSAYREKTGKDVATDQLTVRLLRCDSSDAVLGILQEKAHVFDQHGNGDWDVQLVSLRRLKSIVDILLGISTSGVFGEGIGLVRITKSTYPLQMFFIHFAEGVSGESDICRYRSPTRGVYRLSFLWLQF